MACGRREALRLQAIDLACCTWHEGKVDWERFVRKGILKERERIPTSPLVQEQLDKITAQGGRFIL
jgi:hypothetical protein